jgi:hypothetical protein
LINIISEGLPSFLLKNVTSDQEIRSFSNFKYTNSSKVFKKADVLLFVAAFPKSPNSYVPLDTLIQCTAGDCMTDLNLIFECVKRGQQDLMVIVATMEFSRGRPVELPRKISVSASSSHSAETGGYTVTNILYANFKDGPSAESLSTDITKLESTDESGAHSASLSVARHTVTIASKGDAKVFVQGKKSRRRLLFQGWNTEVSSLSHSFQGERLIFVLYTPEAESDYLEADHLRSCIHPNFLSLNGVLNEDLCKNDELVLSETLDCLKRSDSKGFFMVGFLDYNRPESSPLHAPTRLPEQASAKSRFPLRSIPEQNFGPFPENIEFFPSNLPEELPNNTLKVISTASEPESKTISPPLSPTHSAGFPLDNISDPRETEKRVETVGAIGAVEMVEAVGAVEVVETVETLSPSSSSKNNIDSLLNGAEDSEGTEESPPPLSPRHHVSFILNTPPANPLPAQLFKHALSHILNSTASN